MIESAIAKARSTEPTWDPSRHNRVREGVERGAILRERGRRQRALFGSAFLGAALFALAMRAFAATPESVASIASPAAPPQALAMGDGGLRGDVAVHD